MNLVEYKNVAMQRLNKTIADNPKESMRYSLMGLIEETGEIIAELRKPLFKGNFHEKALDIENIKSELGDLMWYITLICKDYNINIEQFKNLKRNEENNIQLPKREELIRVAINIGQSTGEIVKECVAVYNGNGNNELVNGISEQYRNINELASLLDITIEEILDENVKKINSRYNEKGDVSR